MSTEIRKFQTLELNQKYQVHNYTTLFNNEFPYRILDVSEDGSEETVESFTTPLLCKYVEERKPTGKFNFIVKKIKKVRNIHSLKVIVRKKSQKKLGCVGIIIYYFS